MVEKMDAHLDQEEQELVPLFDRHLTVQEQEALGGSMARATSELMREVVPWMLSLQTQEEREEYFRFAVHAMPPAAVEGLKATARSELSASDWDILTQRVPELVASEVPRK
jgi:hypothetical protein